MMNDTKELLFNICGNYELNGKVKDVVPYGSGHINNTYAVSLESGVRFILQKINTSIFTEPVSLMENVFSVTDFLRNKITKAGGDPNRETLSLVSAKDGKCYYEDESGFWRMYIFVEDALTYDTVSDPKLLFCAGEAFGNFQKMLSDFDASKLHETISFFHNTRKRFDTLKEAVKADKAGRASLVREEIEFALSRESDCDLVLDGIESGAIPLRVTHNDTKLNNVMIDTRVMKGICVVDLDTVMPGSLLYDFGDTLRSGASTAAEDETDLSLIDFSLVHFKSFAEGFLGVVKDSLTPAEIDLLAFSAKLLTFECGMRFLTDYLSGDVYFKIHRENHNLDRCRSQFQLVTRIEEKLDEMNKIVRDILG